MILVLSKKCFPLNSILMKSCVNMKVYVLLAFFFVFFLFCWRSGAPNNQLEEKVAIFDLVVCLLVVVVEIFLGSLYFICSRV